jgi:hypothetical protein
MEFYIRQGATDPILKLKVLDDGRNDRTSANDLLENSSISFNMYDTKTNKPVILNDRCYLATRRERLNQDLKEYCITYRFTSEGTSVPGRYEGIITIEFLDTDLNITSKLIAPIKEKLYINVI